MHNVTIQPKQIKNKQRYKVNKSNIYKKPINFIKQIMKKNIQKNICN